jgi:hypothetical protein
MPVMDSKTSTLRRRRTRTLLYPDKIREWRAETACQPGVFEEKVATIGEIVTEAITQLIYISRIVKKFSFLQNFQTGYGAQPDAYTMVTVSCIPRRQAA